ncbi:hypothetical protein ES703_84599 [subsurface metagenome]
MGGSPSSEDMFLTTPRENTAAANAAVPTPQERARLANSAPGRLNRYPTSITRPLTRSRRTMVTGITAVRRKRIRIPSQRRR